MSDGYNSFDTLSIICMIVGLIIAVYVAGEMVAEAINALTLAIQGMP